MFIVSIETTGYKIVIDQSLALYAILYYKYSPSGFALGSHAYILYCIQTSRVVKNYYTQSIESIIAVITQS